MVFRLMFTSCIIGVCLFLLKRLMFGFARFSATYFIKSSTLGCDKFILYRAFRSTAGLPSASRLLINVLSSLLALAVLRVC